ncbi:MAG: ABC transporter permease [Devosia sp.]|nr:ABC transporter permease [Devosia sp.]
MNNNNKFHVSDLLNVEGATVFFALAVLVLFSSVFAPSFLTPENISNVLVQSVFVMILGIGMTYVLISGGIDLSVGSAMGLAAAVCVYCINAGLPLPLALLLGLATGAAAGFVNAYLIVCLGFADFIATLGTLSLMRGIVEVMTASTRLNSKDPGFMFLAGGSLGGVPFAVLVALVVAIVAGVILARTTMGRAVYGVGLNPKSSFLAGVLVNRVRFSVFVVSGLCAGLSGILLASRLSSVHPAMGTGYELTAIAAAALGGASLSGGRGSVLGTALGALFLAILQNTLSLMSVNAFWFQIITGVIIVLAVLLDGGVRRFVAQRARTA